MRRVLIGLLLLLATVAFADDAVNAGYDAGREDARDIRAPGLAAASIVGSLVSPLFIGLPCVGYAAWANVDDTLPAERMAEAREFDDDDDQRAYTAAYRGVIEEATINKRKQVAWTGVLIGVAANAVFILLLGY